jgi:hypothetical protein
MATYSRPEFIDYCLRSLGAGVLQVNVSPEQVEDRVDEALQFYQAFHSDALHHNFYVHKVTAADVTNKYVTLPEAYAYVTRMLLLSSTTTSYSSQFSDLWQYTAQQYTALQSGSAGGLSGFYVAMSNLQLMQDVLKGAQRIRFSRHMDRVYVEETMKEGEYVVFEGYSIIDPEQYTDVWDDYFLKKYATALIKRQWANNLKKFSNMQLPGGVMFEGQIMYDEANVEIDALEEEMRSTWEFPPDFAIG